MSAGLPLLKNIPSSLRPAFLLTAGLLVAGLALLSFGIMPARKRLHAVKAEVVRLGDTFTGMERDIAGTARQREKTAAVEAERDAFLASGVIEPLLGSFAMRGKSLLDPLAQEAGFTINNVKEDRFIPLQVPQPPPEQLYGRQLIEFTGTGAYTQIVAFVSSAEQAFPLATLSGLRIESQQPTPERHKATITFEWPVKGERRK
jgi:hypothetical protein